MTHVSLLADTDILDLNSFPTRRSSDLFDHVYEAFRDQEDAINAIAQIDSADIEYRFIRYRFWNGFNAACRKTALNPDRKSTRLNSSHVRISYAASCLKK